MYEECIRYRNEMKKELVKERCRKRWGERERKSGRASEREDP